MHSPKQPAKQVLLLFCALLATACSGNSASLSAGAPSAVIDLSSAAASYTKVRQTDGFTAVLKNVAGFRWANMQRQAKGIETPSNSLHVDGVDLDSIKDAVEAGDDAFAFMASQYDTVGDYWKAIDFDPTAEISDGEFRDGLQVLGATYNLQPKNAAENKLQGKLGNTTPSSSPASNAISSKIRSSDSQSQAKAYAKSLAQVMVYGLAATLDEVYIPGASLGLKSSGSYWCFGLCRQPDYGYATNSVRCGYYSDCTQPARRVAATPATPAATPATPAATPATPAAAPTPASPAQSTGQPQPQAASGACNSCL